MAWAGRGCSRAVKYWARTMLNPAKGTGQEIELQAPGGDTLEQGVALAVEDGGGGRRPEKDDGVEQEGQGQDCHQGVAEGGPDRGPVAHAVAAADNGLDALGDAGVEGEHHQGQVGDDPVGGHPHVPRLGQEDAVEHDYHHAGRDLGDQGGRPAGQDAGGTLALQGAAGEVELVLPAEEVGGEHQDADEGGQACGKDRAENAHPAGEEEYPVQHHVGEAPGEHGRHGELGRAVVADEAQQQVVGQKGRGKEQEHPQVGAGHGVDRTLPAKQGDDSTGEKDPRQHEEDGQGSHQIACVGERAVGSAVVILAFLDGVLGGAAHAHHQAAAV